jgi:hypothetical protein
LRTGSACLSVFQSTKDAVLDSYDRVHQKAALWPPEYQFLPHLSLHLIMPCLCSLTTQLSDAKCKVCNVTESKIQAALAVVSLCGWKLNGAPKYPLYQAAKDFEVPQSTLTNCYNSHLTHQQAAVLQQHMPPVQENLLAEFVKQCRRRGILLGLSQLVESAECIADILLGISWLSGYQWCFPDLKPFWSSTFEAPCAQTLNQPSVLAFYDLYLAIVRDSNVKFWNIYNMDKKGSMMGHGRKCYSCGQPDPTSVEHLFFYTMCTMPFDSASLSGFNELSYKLI